MNILKNNNNKVLSTIVLATTIMGGGLLLANNTYADDSTITITIPFEEVNMCNAVVNNITNNYGSEKIEENNCSDETNPNIIMTDSNIESITELYLDSKNITNITGIEYFTNLTNLNLSENQISDLTPLSSLTNLTDLDLRNNQITDLTPLSNLTSLTNLNLFNNQITDLTPLKDLTSLTELYLNNNQITDLTPLKDLTSLIVLDLSNNQISDLSPLSNLTKLNVLSLFDNPFNDITPILRVDLAYPPFPGEDGPNISDVVTSSKKYELPTLFLLYNGTLDVEPVADWVNMLQGMIKENPDSVEFYYSNAYMNEDGKSITILDTTKPAGVNVYINDSGDKFLVASLNIIYEGSEDDPTGPTDEPAVPDTGENTKSADGNVVLNILSCIVPATVMMWLVVRHFSRREK